jgi:RNA polymerase sigma-70 factor (ECF subfamily)
VNKRRINNDNYIEQLRARNEHALEYVVERYGGLLYSILRKKLYLIPDRIDECFDDVLLKVWDHAENFDESRCEFKTWLAAIARYRAIDYLRKAKREEMNMTGESLDEMVIEPGAYDERLRDIEEAIDCEAEEMLSCLSPKDQEIFRRIYLYGDSVDDVSKDMNLPRSQVYNHTSRGKKKLQKFYVMNRGLL